MKKSAVVVVVVIAVIAVGLYFSLSGNGEIAKEEKFTKAFINNIYEVKDHVRYEELAKILTVPSAPAGTQGVFSISDEVSKKQYKAYLDIYEPITTKQGLDYIFANGYPTFADQIAKEEGYTFKVGDITLAKQTSSTEDIVYDFTAKIVATSDKDATVTDIEIFGNIKLVKDDKDVYLINAFNTKNQDLYKLGK